MAVVQQGSDTTRKALSDWQEAIKKNSYTDDKDFQHTIAYTFKKEFSALDAALTEFGDVVPTQLEPLVNENNLAANLPMLRQYDALGHRIDAIIHHPTYLQAGELIYQTGLLGKMLEPHGLSQTLAFLFLSSQAGEAGHNCPIACSAGIVRILQKLKDIPHRSHFLEKLTEPSIYKNFTGAQFLTEIQGGSDVGANTSTAELVEKNVWRIRGEKWFCSNAGADLMLVTARYNPEIEGTKGLALFLVPAQWEGKKNLYIIRRLKDKIGTRSMATGEIEFQGAYAYLVGNLENSFHLVMENILHLSRLFNSFSVLGMGRRALRIATEYARYRIAFANAIIHYPLVQETLAQIRAENTALVASMFATAKMQDQLDAAVKEDPQLKLLLRLIVNLMKYLTANLSVKHIHQCLGVLAGNGAIESFSPIPRLLRDCIVCENWEGTDNVLRMQILRDFSKFKLDDIFLTFIRGEISSIESEVAAPLKNALKALEQELRDFNQLDSRQKTLNIRSLVDHMGVLYSATMLLKESIAQHDSTGSDSKGLCFKLFCYQHLKSGLNSASYLDLICTLAVI